LEIGELEIGNGGTRGYTEKRGGTRRRERFIVGEDLDDEGH